MLIRILDNRKVEKQEEEGTQNENRIVTLNLEVPEDYSSFIKKIVFITEDGNFFDYIENDNTYILKNNITKYRKLKSYIWLTDLSTNKDFRSETFDLEFNDNENPSDYVPSEQEQSQFDLMVEQLEELIEEVEAIPTLSREIVEELPTEDIDPDTIYMVLREDTEPNNIYDEWMYINNAWEKIGSTQVDIKNITDQIEAIEKDLYGEVEKRSENGSITLNNSKEDRDIVIDKLYGDTSQETTEGYNLLPMTSTNYIETENGYKWDNGSIFSTNSVTLKANTTYYLNFILLVAPTSSTSFTSYANTSASGTTISEFSLGNINTYNLNTLYQKTYTPTEDTPLSIRQYGNSNSDNYEFQLWLTTDNTKTSFEKYTGGIPSPNPTFPENINVVTGTQEVVVRNNLIEDIDITQGTFNSTSTANRCFINGGFIIQANHEYKLTTNINTNIYKFGVLVSNNAFPTTNTNWVLDSGWKTTDTYTFTSTGNGYLGINIAKQDNTNFTPTELTEIKFILSDSITTYTLHLGNMEFAGIGDYVDDIEFNVDEGKWYKKKAINKVTYNGSENWNYNSNNTIFVLTGITLGVFPAYGDKPLILSNYFSAETFESEFAEQVDYGISFGATKADRFCIRNKDITSPANFKTWLSTHNTIVYYPLETSTDIEITNETLIQDLNELLNLKQFNGTTIIEIDGIPQFHIIYDGNKIENMEDEIEGKLDDSDIATTITSSSTNAKVAGAKAVYDYVSNVVGNIDTLLDDINGEVI